MNIITRAISGRRFYCKADGSGAPAIPQRKKDIAAILSSIAEHGLVPPHLAKVKGLSQTTSITPADCENFLCGREMVFNSAEGSPPLEDLLKNCLYDFSHGILSVMSEDNAYFKEEALFDSRSLFGIIFAVRSCKINSRTTPPTHVFNARGSAFNYP